VYLYALYVYTFFFIIKNTKIPVNTGFGSESRGAIYIFDYHKTKVQKTFLVKENKLGIT
jgi:hypothetical protein